MPSRKPRPQSRVPAQPPFERPVSAQPFGAHDYHIEYAPAEAPREVNIRARVALPLRVGDRYTVGRHGLVYDLMVEDVSRAAGRWTARCRVLNQPW